MNADARADTVMSYLPDDAADRPTGLVQAVPLTAPVARQTNGIFLDEVLGDAVSSGGRLRNLMDLLLDAPPHTMDVVLDPALADAVTDMAAGLRGAESREPSPMATPPVPGTGDVRGRSGGSRICRPSSSNQNVYLLPWGNPDASALASARPARGPDDHRRGGSQRTPRRTATARRSSTGRSTVSRRGPDCPLPRQPGANLHVLSQESLTELTP